HPHTKASSIGHELGQLNEWKRSTSRDVCGAWVPPTARENRWSDTGRAVNGRCGPPACGRGNRERSEVASWLLLPESAFRTRAVANEFEAEQPNQDWMIRC